MNLTLPTNANLERDNTKLPQYNIIYYKVQGIVSFNFNFKCKFLASVVPFTPSAVSHVCTYIASCNDI